MRKISQRFAYLAGVGGVATMLAFAGPAQAMTVPVHDQQVAQQVTQVAQHTQTQIEYLKEIRNLTQQILEALGGQGSASIGDTFGGGAGGGPGGAGGGAGGGMPGMGGGGGMPGIPGMPGAGGGGPWDMFAGGGGFLQQLTNLMPMAEQMMGMFGGMGGGMGGGDDGGAGGGFSGGGSGGGSSGRIGSECSNVNFSNIEAVRACVESAMFAPSSPTESDRIAVRDNRQNVLRNTATQTMALGLASRNNAASMAERSQALESMVTSASTLREDIKAGNAVLLALHQEIGSLQALFASFAELTGAGVIANDPRIER